MLGKVLGFTTRIINPDRLLDKFTGKEGLFENSPFDDRTRLIISKSKKPLGILVDKDLHNVNEIFLPVFGKKDLFLLNYAQKLIFNNNSKVTIVDINTLRNKSKSFGETFSSFLNAYSENIEVIGVNDINGEILGQKDLMMVSLESWKELVDSQTVWLSNVPSTLIIKP